MDPPRFYAVIFDAGSTGTRPFIYRIFRQVVNDDGGVLQRAQVVEVVKHNGKSLGTSPSGIHQVHSAEDLEKHLKPRFEEVEKILHSLGNAYPIKYYLYATGGVRDDLNSDQQEELHEWVKEYIEGTRGIARTDYEYEPISGTEEAKYGWVAAHRSIGRPYDAGYVEMGGATAQIAFPLPNNNEAVKTTAKKIARRLNLAAGLSKKVKVEVEDVGRQFVFLASYPLGKNAGYKAYRKALYANGNALGLTAGEVKDGKTIFYDPAKRIGSPDEVRDNITKFRRDDGLEASQGNPSKTFFLTRYAVDALFPGGAAITEPLDPVLRKLDFIGASNFFYSLGVALHDKRTVKLSKLHQAIRKDREKTYEQTNGELARMPPGERDLWRSIFEKSIFTTRWTMRVLRQAFGISLMGESDEGGRDITFTPYNGDNRFSWTLGTAVLLASSDPEKLSAPVDAIRAQQ